MTAPSERPAGGGAGRVSWEIVEVPTGQVLHRGHRDVRLTQIEVLIRPAVPFPRPGPNLPRVTAELLGWLVTRGRARTLKRLRLAAGFWLVVPEHPGPALPPGLALQGELDGQDTFCWEWFTLRDRGATATKLEDAGSLQLRWSRNRHGLHELTELTFLTDVPLRLSESSADPREPRWRVRVLAGSVIAWPEAGNGLQLVPRLWSGPAKR